MFRVFSQEAEYSERGRIKPGRGAVEMALNPLAAEFVPRSTMQGSNAAYTGWGRHGKSQRKEGVGICDLDPGASGSSLTNLPKEVCPIRPLLGGMLMSQQYHSTRLSDASLLDNFTVQQRRLGLSSLQNTCECLAHVSAAIETPQKLSRHVMKPEVQQCFSR